MDIATLPALASTSSPLLPATVPAAPDALATARFNALMQHSPVPNAQAAATATSAGAPTTTATSPAVLSNSVGDRILHGMEGVSNNFQSAWKSVNATLDASAQSTSMQDMMRLQLQLVQVSVQYELVSKAVSRSTQNFDQLVRIQ
jgi:type III secretion protein I